MTKFENIELIYNQFSNLADEIHSMIDNEDFDELAIKLEYKDTLIKKLTAMKKTLDLTSEEYEKMNILEQKLKIKEMQNIDYLSKLHDDVGQKLKNTKNKVRMSSAYAIKTQENSGVYFDLTE